MFTEEMIEAAHEKVGSGADYPRLVQDLKNMGVRTYSHNVADGANEFFGDAGFSVTIRHSQETIPVATHASENAFRQCLAAHQRGMTDYQTFCKEAGEAGVAKWISDLGAMTVTYQDLDDESILVEVIPSA